MTNPKPAAPERCEPCLTGRRNGQPCDVEICRCRCHREGRASVEALQDKTLDKARAVPRRRKVGPQAWVETINLKDIMDIPSFTEEFPEKRKPMTSGGQPMSANQQEACPTCGSPKREEPYSYIPQRVEGGWAGDSSEECGDPWHDALPVEPQPAKCGHPVTRFIGYCVRDGGHRGDCEVETVPGVPPTAEPIEELINKYMITTDRCGRHGQATRAEFRINCRALLKAHTAASPAAGAQGGEDGRSNSSTVDNSDVVARVHSAGEKGMSADRFYMEWIKTSFDQGRKDWWLLFAEAYTAELKAKIAELEQELLTEKNMLLILQREGLRDLDDLRKAERERDQAREALRKFGYCALDASEFQKCAKCQKSIFWHGDRWYHSFAADVKHCGEAAVPPSEGAPPEMSNNKMPTTAWAEEEKNGDA